jgi:hypothetical protein
MSKPHIQNIQADVCICKGHALQAKPRVCIALSLGPRLGVMPTLRAVLRVSSCWSVSRAIRGGTAVQGATMPPRRDTYSSGNIDTNPLLVHYILF